MIVYSTETPLITRNQHTFDYPCKRDAYVDCCYACLSLNQLAKSAPDNYRHTLYRLKHRWIEKLYCEGYCVRAEQGERLVWQVTFLVDGVKFQWHIPDQMVTWPLVENRAAVFFEWRNDMHLRTWALDEAVSLIEWVLQ